MASPSIAPAPPPRTGRTSRGSTSLPPPSIPPPALPSLASISPPAAPRSATIPPPATAEDSVREVQRLFDAGPESGLTVHVYGGAPTGEAFIELLDSLRMYDERYRHGDPVLVNAPTRAALSRAIAILGAEDQRRRALGHVLETFGPKLVHPLGDVLEDVQAGVVAARLSMMRDILLAQIAELRLTPESQRLLSADVRRLLSDGYIAIVAENEERYERPRVRALAREILRLLGATFQRAFARLPDESEILAAQIADRLAGDYPLKELPARLHREVVETLEAHLWEATSPELEPALRSLFAEHGVTPAALPHEAFRELSEKCWEIVVGCC